VLISSFRELFTSSLVSGSGLQKYGLIHKKPPLARKVPGQSFPENLEKNMGSDQKILILPRSKKLRPQSLNKTNINHFVNPFSC
jgi:hypothetical protein